MIMPLSSRAMCSLLIVWCNSIHSFSLLMGWSVIFFRFMFLSFFSIHLQFYSFLVVVANSPCWLVLFGVDGCVLHWEDNSV